MLLKKIDNLVGIFMQDELHSEYFIVPIAKKILYEINPSGEVIRPPWFGSFDTLTG